jgi:hypothetical protein
MRWELTEGGMCCARALQEPPGYARRADQRASHCTPLIARIISCTGAVAPNGQSSKREGSDEGCTSLEHPIASGQNGTAGASKKGQPQGVARGIAGANNMDYPSFPTAQVRELFETFRAKFLGFTLSPSKLCRAADWHSAFRI